MAYQQASVAPHMAEFAVDLDWSNLPGTVRREAGRAWLNWVACAVGGARTATMDAAVRGIVAMESRGEVPLLARRECVGVSHAALLGCLSSSAHTYDDTHLATITHPTGPVAAALLAVAAKLARSGSPVPGRDLMAALVVGLELECRVSCAIKSGGASLGWYMTGLSGGIGAAAAVGRLLGLTAERMVYAIGLAAAQACGFRATHGSMAITYVPGLAARNGVEAAYMASADFACGSHAVDGQNGLLQVLTGATDAALIRQDLGTCYEFLNNTYKPYPCGIVIHPAIDACLHLAREQGVRHEDVLRMDLRVHPDALNLTWRKLPDNEFDAQVSLFHWAAAALVHGAAGIAQGQIACVTEPAVRALQERTQAAADAGLADNQAAVTVHLRDGRVLEQVTQSALGSLDHPMSDAQLAEKFRGLAAPVLGDPAAARLLEFCLAIEAAGDAADILKPGTAA
ncbi:MmgE/PrpD family protein [Candidimonas nitroreducens]|uniref:2-methylcitrate dehydratase n=1 Tax=Candidimonas nitroreducens TaxID=683354 RepID=A0A225LWQ4_9BURK|nr:MmgE/PrpD family protein [Candidimonas nitroreducens]OWT53744.1 2-methylcitrate dehydratase [Candidimonas nitroreducens]